jgi:putative membrane protein insertion efficiency factor
MNSKNSKKIWLIPIKGYQYISMMLPAGCRYYPTCSQYAKWSFDTSSPHKALYQSSVRILRCNPLFDGGIDYPLISYTPPTYLLPYRVDMILKYWIVPKIGDSRYYVIGVFDR